MQFQTHVFHHDPRSGQQSFPEGTQFFVAGQAAFLELPTGEWFYLSHTGELRRVRVTDLGAAVVRERSTAITEEDFRLRLLSHPAAAA